MVRIARDVTWLIGRTPLVELGRLSPPGGGRVVGKLESFNPTRSNKDRAALGMIVAAERSGCLRAGGTIVECSAGDTGIALAMVAAARGHRLVLTMPANLHSSRCNLLRALGAEIVLTDAEAGMRGAMQRAEQIVRERPGALCLQPFTNRDNAAIHETTAREIWEDTDGAVAAVVCPVGTGGTAAGCLSFFRRQAPGVAVVGVEPASSPVLSGGPPGRHDLPGLGAGFVPGILAPQALDEIIAVREQDAFACLRQLAAHEALLVGPASAAVAWAALEIARRPERAGALIVAVLPDSSERYADHAAYSDREER
jgi:cysteine synthase A